MRYLKSFYVMVTFSLALLAQDSCIAAPSKVSLYLLDGAGPAKPDARLLLKERPAFILDPGEILAVRLIQHDSERFSIEVRLAENVIADLARITSANVGKRLIFISNSRILFSPLILGPIPGGNIVVELVSIKKKDAEDVAGHFGSTFEFYDHRTSRNEEHDVELKRAYEFMDSGDCDRAIEVFDQIVTQSKDHAKRIAIYNEIGICYRLKSDKSAAADTYRKLVSEPVSIDLDNYMIIAQAYLYLSQFEKAGGKGSKSHDYLDKGISTLEYVVKNFPATRSAEWANLTIGTYELLRGNIGEARKLATMVKRGDFKAQGYLLVGLSYEYEKKYQIAREEYKSLVAEFPDAEESKIARDFIKKLDSNKANVDEFLSALEQG